jgi:site-specific DNA-methyltransferase (adenine-specific)
MDRFINNITLGDCQHSLPLLPSSCVHLTVTSPPYDNLREYMNFNWEWDLFEIIVKELYRVTIDGGVVVWIVGDSVVNGSETGSSFKQALYFMQMGFKLHDTMIFQKNTSSFPARRDGTRYTQIFEYMFIFVKGKIRTSNLICDKHNKYHGYTNRGKNTIRLANGDLKVVSNIKPVPEFSPRNNIWLYKVNYGCNTVDKDAHKHPAIFPEQLAKDHILSWSNEGDVILDPFAGSGTTLKVAKQLKRKFIGFEIAPLYVEIAEKRIDNVEI